MVVYRLYIMKSNKKDLNIPKTCPKCGSELEEFIRFYLS